jgi:hypothetical protein
MQWRLDQAAKEGERHEKVMRALEELKTPHWTVTPNFWLTMVSAMAAIVAAICAWFALKR